jgi:cyclin T
LKAFAIDISLMTVNLQVEEQPRKLEHVIKILNICLEKNENTRESYPEQAQELVFNENVLLQTLGFDVAIDHP